MNGFYIFLIRYFIAAICSVVLMRLFRPEMHMAWAALLGLFIVGASYFSRHFRKKNK